jgi:hypothetical protein
VTECGDPAALSVIVTAAVRPPAAVGVKVAEMLQLPPAATLDPQVFVWPKSPLLAPVTAMLMMLSAAVPGLLKVTLCAVLDVPTFREANISAVGLSDACGTPPPMPESVKEWGDPAALSVIVIEAVRLPAAVGVKVTEMLQLPPAATLAPHVLVCPKSPLLAPVTAMLEMVSAALPGLLKVTLCAVLELPTFCEANARLAGLREAWGAVGDPAAAIRKSATASPAA